MKLYKTTIIPTSNFATPLKGDTLFGQMCWAIRYKYGEERLDKLLSDYENKPFLIVSDGFAKGYLPKPSLPSMLLNEDTKQKKQNRKKIWLNITELLDGNYAQAKTDDEIKSKDKSLTVIRNSINYKTFTTDDSGIFVPYGVEEMSLNPKDIYFLIDEAQFCIDELEGSFRLLSQMGYGKDTTIGKGRFDFSDFELLDFGSSSAMFMSLSPFSPQDLKCRELFYEPFVRFGKHGNSLSSKNTFKKPLLLANSAAVVIFDEVKDIRYIGKAIKGHSSYQNTVHQGYGIVVPIKGDLDERAKNI